VGTRRIDIPGRGPVDVNEIGFRPVQEFWSEYVLDDGTSVRLKLVVTAVYSVPDAFDADGNPMYLVNSTNVMAVNAPESLRRKD
jgi:hypothetical protein